MLMLKKQINITLIRCSELMIFINALVQMLPMLLLMLNNKFEKTTYKRKTFLKWKYLKRNIKIQVFGIETFRKILMIILQETLTAKNGKKFKNVKKKKYVVKRI